MESAGILSQKYYTHYAPTKSAEAIRKASYQLYCCDDMLIMGKLGSGYFASVFMVYHRPTSQFMAMKLTKEASAHRREIDLLNRLCHKNVIKFLGSCVIGARFACLTELANGGNLSALLSAKHVDLPWFVRISLALDIAYGLQHLHSHNLLHRDLSSANILIRITFPGSHPFPTDLDPEFLPPLLPCDTNDHDDNGTTIPITPPNTPFYPVTTTDRQNPFQLSNGFPLRLHVHDPVVRLDRMGDATEHMPSVLNGDSESTRRRSSPDPTPNRWLSAVPVVPPVWRQTVWSSLCVPSKPQPHYTAVVADLGLCLDLNSSLSEPVSLVGNPYYIAPECLTETAPYTFAADIFAFGLLMCELATRSLNDGTQIPRTQDFGLDYAQLPVNPGVPDWFIQSAVDACTVDHQKRPTLESLISRLSVGRQSNGGQPADGATDILSAD